MKVASCSALSPATYALSAPLLIALDEEAHRTHRLTDPAESVRTVSTFMDAMTDELARFGTLRLQALATMRRDGASYDRIAARTGLSKSRVAQLVHACRS
jgi:hypothetical protein